MSFFITFEGIEGSGKTTQIELLRKHLEQKGYQVVCTREPGGTKIGELIRGILLNTEVQAISPWTELLLYESCRAQLVNEIIKPAILDNKIVLCDRFTDSTIVYQAYGRGLNLEAIHSLNKWVIDGMLPNITFVIDCPPEIGLNRALSRISARKDNNKEDRFEKEDIEFHKRIQEGYIKLAKKAPDRIKIINGNRNIEVINKEICAILDNKLV